MHVIGDIEVALEHRYRDARRLALHLPAQATRSTPDYVIFATDHGNTISRMVVQDASSINAVLFQLGSDAASNDRSDIKQVKSFHNDAEMEVGRPSLAFTLAAYPQLHIQGLMDTEKPAGSWSLSTEHSLISYGLRCFRLRWFIFRWTRFSRPPKLRIKGFVLFARSSRSSIATKVSCHAISFLLTRG